MSDAPRILVIDDEEVVRRSCERILREESMRVTSVTRGEEGLAHLAAEEVDAVLLDLKMPGAGGMETLARIRDSWPDLPVVVMTGFGTLTTRLECIVRGASAWLPKPFDPEELLDALRIALEAG